VYLIECRNVNFMGRNVNLFGRNVNLLGRNVNLNACCLTQWGTEGRNVNFSFFFRPGRNVDTPTKMVDVYHRHTSWEHPSPCMRCWCQLSSFLVCLPAFCLLNPTLDLTIIRNHTWNSLFSGSRPFSTMSKIFFEGWH